MRKRLSVLFMLLISVLIVAGCRDRQEEASLDISFEDYEFGDVDRICLGHELQKAYIENEAAIALFKELISELQGSNGISSQGYADGGYSISMMAQGERVFRLWISEKSIVFGNINDPVYPDRYEYADAAEGAAVYERIKLLCDLCFAWENEKLGTGIVTNQGIFINVDYIEGYSLQYGIYTDTEGISKKTLPVTFTVNDTGEAFCFDTAGIIPEGSYDTLKDADDSADWGLSLPEGVLEEYIDGDVGTSIYKYTAEGKEGYFAVYGRKEADVAYSIVFPAGISKEEVYRIIERIHVEAWGD